MDGQMDRWMDGWTDSCTGSMGMWDQWPAPAQFDTLVIGGQPLIMDQTDGRIDGWMDGRMDGQMDGWMDRQMDGWMDRLMDRWMDRQMDRQKDGWMDRWTDSCTGSMGMWDQRPAPAQFDMLVIGGRPLIIDRMDGQTDRRTDGWTDRQMDGQTDRWTGGADGARRLVDLDT